MATEFKPKVTVTGTIASLTSVLRPSENLEVSYSYAPMSHVSPIGRGLPR